MKVLIVEDDPASRKYLLDTVVTEGHDTRASENGEIGLKVYNEFKPDLVLSDIQMPVMDGLKLLEAIREQSNDVIVVIITAFGTEEYAMKALRLGATNYMPKPVRHGELLPLLRKYNSVIENRTVETEILGMIVQRTSEGLSVI